MVDLGLQVVCAVLRGCCSFCAGVGEAAGLHNLEKRDSRDHRKCRRLLRGGASRLMRRAVTEGGGASRSSVAMAAAQRRQAAPRHAAWRCGCADWRRLLLAEGVRAPRVIGLQRGLVAARADRLRGRTDAVARFPRDELLDDAILERVVADYHKARSKAEQTVSPRQRLSQAG